MLRNGSLGICPGCPCCLPGLTEQPEEPDSGTRSPRERGPGQPAWPALSEALGCLHIARAGPASHVSRSQPFPGASGGSVQRRRQAWAALVPGVSQAHPHQAWLWPGGTECMSLLPHCLPDQGRRFSSAFERKEELGVSRLETRRPTLTGIGTSDRKLEQVAFRGKELASGRLPRRS